MNAQERVLRAQEEEQKRLKENMIREFEVQKKDAVAAVRRVRKELQNELALGISPSTHPYIQCVHTLCVCVCVCMCV